MEKKCYMGLLLIILCLGMIQQATGQNAELFYSEGLENNDYTWSFMGIGVPDNVNVTPSDLYGIERGSKVTISVSEGVSDVDLEDDGITNYFSITVDEGAQVETSVSLWGSISLTFEITGTFFFDSFLPFIFPSIIRQDNGTTITFLKFLQSSGFILEETEDTYFLGDEPNFIEIDKELGIVINASVTRSSGLVYSFFLEQSILARLPVSTYSLVGIFALPLLITVYRRRN